MPRAWGVLARGDDVTLQSYLPPPKRHTAFAVWDDLRVISPLYPCHVDVIAPQNCRAFEGLESGAACASSVSSRT